MIFYSQHFATKLWNFTNFNFIAFFSCCKRFCSDFLDQNLVYHGNFPLPKSLYCQPFCYIYTACVRSSAQNVFQNISVRSNIISSISRSPRVYERKRNGDRAPNKPIRDENENIDQSKWNYVFWGSEGKCIIPTLLTRVG